MRKEMWEFNDNCYSFIPKEGAKGWYMDGFVLSNDRTDDLRGEYGLRVEFAKVIKERTPLKVIGTGWMNRDQLNEEVLARPQITVSLKPGSKEVVLPFRDFCHIKGQQLFWGYFAEFAFETTAEISQVSVVGGNPLRITCSVKSLYGTPGSVLSYQVQVENCSQEEVQVQIEAEEYGWEVCRTGFNHSNLLLAAGAKQQVTVSVETAVNFIPGARETQVIHFIPDSDMAGRQSLTLITGCRVPHPYVLHDQAGWDHVRNKTGKYDWAAKDFERYLEIADTWEPARVKDDYVRNAEDQNSVNGFIETIQSEYCMMTAVAYTITGKKEYAEKCVKLIRIFTGEYVARQQVCTQALVQEGHFFEHLGMACDILWDTGFLTGDDKQKLEVCFRLFMSIVDKELYIGGISNHYIAEIVGSLVCAMVLQDAERIERFLYGQCGFIPHLVKSVFDDGWYYECSLGYNLWVMVLYLQTGLALEKLGYYILHENFPASYSPNLNVAKEELYGITMAQWGPRDKNYRNIEMMIDAMIPYADYRGIIFAMNDAEDQSINVRRHGFRPYDLAYHVYRKKAYGYLAGRSEGRDCIYGEEVELGDFDGSFFYRQSVHAPNGGYAVLRSQNTSDRERLQAALHFGSHGGYHGHFDRLDMVSLMRYGKSFYFPEIVWYGYGSFLYKFLVQNSIMHNMTVVDGKNQEAVEGREKLFYAGENIQVSTAEVTARWSNPPYGGMTYSPDQGFAEKALEEGRTFKFPDNPPGYGEITGYTEPVKQLRTMVVTNQYVVLYDRLEGEQEHAYDYLYHPLGLKELTGLEKTGWQQRYDDNPLSSGQFITDCDLYQSKARETRMFFDMDLNADPMFAKRMCHGGDGQLKMDLYHLNAEDTKVIIGRSPVYRGVRKRIHYEVWQEEEKLLEGDTGAWIMGAAKLNIQVPRKGKVQLRLTAKNFPEKFPELYMSSDNTIYLADTKALAKGRELTLENTLPADISEAVIEGIHYQDFICLNPRDYDKEAVLSFDAAAGEEINCVLGCSYPPRITDQERKFVAFRKTGKAAEFVTLIELYETKRGVSSAVYHQETQTVEVRLSDGTREHLHFLLDEQNQVEFLAEREGKVICSEKTRS